MAIAIQTFNAGNSSSCANALKAALEASGIFDDVSIDNMEITCSKDIDDIPVPLLTIDLGVTAGGDILTWANAAGDASGSVSLGANVTPNSFASVSTVGNVVFCILSTSASLTGNADVFALAVDQTKDGNVCVYYAKHQYGGSITHYTVSSESIAADSSVGVTSPLYTNKSGICLYAATAQNRNGSCEVFTHTSGIRFSPALHTNAKTIDGVTPVKFVVDGREYLTDGYIAIADEAVTT